MLAVIRTRLASKLPCLVVSTQLIEAGVDVDFPIAFRALGPLDAIIQVAGRVDREGKLTAAAGEPAGCLVVFESEDGKTPPHDYSEATAVTAGLARERDVQVNDIAAMQKYSSATTAKPTAIRAAKTWQECAMTARSPSRRWPKVRDD